MGTGKCWALVTERSHVLQIKYLGSGVVFGRIGAVLADVLIFAVGAMAGGGRVVMLLCQ